MLRAGMGVEVSAFHGDLTPLHVPHLRRAQRRRPDGPRPVNDFARSLRDFFVSLRLTVVLLALGIVLVFAATLAQVDLGIWAVQQQFFHAFVAIWHVGPLFIPLPGGYLIGSVLLINLIAAHFYRFKFTWRKLGIWLAHVGLILLLLGELFSGLWQEVFTMKIEQGETVRFAEHERRHELAIIDTTDPKFDDVVAIPQNVLAAGTTVQHPQLPFRVTGKFYYPNSVAQPRAQVPNPPPTPANTGLLHERYVITPQPVSNKDEQRNIPAAAVELAGPQPLGTWALTEAVPFLGENQQIEWRVPGPQPFDYNGRSWGLVLRPERHYLPFSLTLLELRHDIYPGTDIPKNFSSRVRLVSDDGHDDREVLIYMNNPLRYAGLTFYQYQMNAPGGYTVLQVVRNPSWLMPYIACAIMTLGLVLQFGLHLIGFAAKRRALAAAAA